MMFATLIFDREPLKASDVPAGFVQWTHSVGGFAMIGLVLFFLVALPRWRAEDRARIPGWMRSLFVGLTGAALVGYVAYFLVVVAVTGGDLMNATPPPWVSHLLTVASCCAIGAAFFPFVLNLANLRFRRIFALAKLSFKEAIRRRVLYAFSGMLLVFLFATWFIPSMPKDQVRTYVGIVFSAMTYLLIFTALLVSAFSIPSDIRQQTIHTIVTKPVERFEIVLGRFLGFLALMTLILVVMTSISLLYVLRGIHPEAAAESLKARIPHYGDLRFENTDSDKAAINVGREWEYRTHITRPGPGQEPGTARWDYVDMPSDLANRKDVRCEYSFDVYRTTKGDEGRDVYCTFRFFTWRFKKGNEEAYRTELNKRKNAGEPVVALNQELSEKYGYFEINSQPVTDYRTQSFAIPGGIFKNMVQADAERESELKVLNETKVPFRVRVTCDSLTQYVGMAKADFYLRLDESQAGAERGRFALNFFKGAFGLWLQLALIIGLAVCMSTYLNGVITLLVTAVLFFGGLGRDFVQQVAMGKNQGGGPLEAIKQFADRAPTSAGLADSTAIGDKIIYGSDNTFRFVVGRVLDAIPDMDRYSKFTDYVAEGFNISLGQMGLVFLMLMGYLLPWGVLAFYLIHWREIANPQ